MLQQNNSGQIKFDVIQIDLHCLKVPIYNEIAKMEHPIHYFLDITTLFSLLERTNVQLLLLSIIGNPVGFGDGPAAVVGDERRRSVNSNLLIVML